MSRTGKSIETEDRSLVSWDWRDGRMEVTASWNGFIWGSIKMFWN